MDSLPSQIDRTTSLQIGEAWLGLAPLPPLGVVSDLALSGPPPPLVAHKEWEHVQTLRGYRRATFVGGRQALRCAAEAAFVPLGPVLSNARGAPAVPLPFAASVSHKLDPKASPNSVGSNVAAALFVEREAPNAFVGVDIEVARERRPGLERHILTEAELGLLRALPESLQPRAVLRAFSMKEALYKAVDPHVQRYVGFREVELDSLVATEVRFNFGLKFKEGPFRATGRFLENDSLIISIVRLEPGSTHDGVS